MSFLKQGHFNLGIPQLLPEWKKMLSPHFFFADLFAGITVAFVAIPLSLAIALASGVSPGTGLVTAIIAGIICALFGGTPLAVSGPAAAMSVIIADVVERFGIHGLVYICLLAGIMQLISGILGLGKLGRYVPLPVISGFTAGIGVIILIGQLPRIFGFEPPSGSHIFTVLAHITDDITEASWVCVVLVAATIGFIKGLPRIFPKVPAILPSVILISIIVYIFKPQNVPLIGEIPRSLPSPIWPTWPSNITVNDLLLNSFVIYLLASLETLLSSSAIDKLTSDKKHNPDQELIGQGLGNISVSMFGGIPITGVIARSATNVRAGAKTRRASIIHALILLLAIYVAAPLISFIPIVALAGVLFTIAISMINYREFMGLWHTSRYEAAIYAITFFIIIFVDLLAGVQAGIIAACLFILFRTTRTHLNITTSSDSDVLRISFVGALTFLSAGTISELMQKLKTYDGRMVLVDLSNIRNVDMSGAAAIVDLCNECKERNLKFYIQGLPLRFESFFRANEGGDEILENHYIISEQELKEKEDDIAPRSAHDRLLHGVQRFYAEKKHNDKRLFAEIAKRQNPHTLFIACSDSRVVPSLITYSEPGELFIMRNIGNVVPPYQVNSHHSETAALEFALSTFDISDIVICGHANCGAVMASLKQDTSSFTPSIQSWIGIIKSQLKVPADTPINDASRQNVLNQMENLKQFPIVQKKLAEGDLMLHAWFFDFDQSLVWEWKAESGKFESIVADAEGL